MQLLWYRREDWKDIVLAYPDLVPILSQKSAPSRPPLSPFQRHLSVVPFLYPSGLPVRVLVPIISKKSRRMNANGGCEYASSSYLQEGVSDERFASQAGLMVTKDGTEPN